MTHSFLATSAQMPVRKLADALNWLTPFLLSFVIVFMILPGFLHGFLQGILPGSLPGLSDSLYAQSIEVQAVMSEARAPGEQQTIVTSSGDLFLFNHSVILSASSSMPLFEKVQHLSLSQRRHKIGLLNIRDVRDLQDVKEDITRVTLDHEGLQMSASPIPYYGDDPSLEIYSFDDGHSVVRENVSSFSFFDPAGRLLFPLSNASGSKEGEAFSEFSSDPGGETVIIYNPSIQRADGTVSSRANLLKRSGKSLQSFFSSSDRQIYSVKVTDSGSFFTLVEGQPGENSEIHLFDRFGTLLMSHEVDFDASHAHYLPETHQVIAYSSSRAAVYDAAAWNRLGSSSIRETILGADFFPEDGMIVIITGRKDGETIKSPAFVAIDINRREIARGSIGNPILLTSGDPVFSRQSKNKYLLDGVGVPLTLTVKL